MKQKINYYALVISLIGLICLQSVLKAQESILDEQDKDNYGKVIGQIVDPETGEPVNEKFQVCGFNWNNTDPRYHLRTWCDSETDENGYLAIDLLPGTYGFLFTALEPNSKYSRMAFHPFYEEMPEEYKEIFSLPIRVEKGKITKFVKKAIVGGGIKVNLVDLEGKPVDPTIAFPGRSIKISGYFVNYNLSPGDSYFNFRMKNGELSKYGFFPDNSWEMRLEFLRIGYEKVQKKDIVIKPNDITQINVVIDPYDMTGVEGFILDGLGKPQENFRISFFSKKKPINGYYTCHTDSNGHYIMTGMPEGFYKIRIYDGREYYFMYQNVIIEIKKDILLHRNFNLSLSD